jgi:SHS2 domain-containing protein
VIRGCPVDHFNDDIKAVTYHGAEVVNDAGKWRTPVIFDI